MDIDRLYEQIRIKDQQIDSQNQQITDHVSNKLKAGQVGQQQDDQKYKIRMMKKLERSKEGLDGKEKQGVGQELNTTRLDEKIQKNKEYLEKVNQISSSQQLGASQNIENDISGVYSHRYDLKIGKVNVQGDTEINNNIGSIHHGNYDHYKTVEYLPEGTLDREKNKIQESKIKQRIVQEVRNAAIDNSQTNRQNNDQFQVQNSQNSQNSSSSQDNDSLQQQLKVQQERYRLFEQQLARDKQAMDYILQQQQKLHQQQLERQKQYQFQRQKVEQQEHNQQYLQQQMQQQQYQQYLQQQQQYQQYLQQQQQYQDGIQFSETLQPYSREEQFQVGNDINEYDQYTVEQLLA